MEETSTFIQVDLQNLFLSSARGQKLDFEKIWDSIKNRETEILTEAIIYTVRSSEFDSSKFETKLRSIGYDIKTKNLPKILKRGRDLLTHDVSITIDCLSRIDLFGKWILMSNNGSFSDLSKYLRDRGKKVEIWCFRENFDPNLELYADRMQFLDDNFLRKPSISVFGINSFEGILDSTSYRSAY